MNKYKHTVSTNNFFQTNNPKEKTEFPFSLNEIYKNLNEKLNPPLFL